MIVVCGEALVDLEPAEDGALLRANPGGSPYNVAVALGRLGTPTAFVGRLSRDAFGRMLRDRLTEAGVDQTWTGTATEPTTIAVVDLDDYGRPSYTFHVQDTADRVWRAEDVPAGLPEGVVAVHAGSLALMLPPGGALLEAMLVRERGRGRLVSIDPNVRPALGPGPAEYRAMVERWVGMADLVKASEEDLVWLYPEEPVPTVVQRWLVRGPSLVVITAGSDGSAGWTADGAYVRIGAEPVEVVDSVGAGDAYTAGLLDALSRFGDLTPDALRGLSEVSLGNVLEHAAHVAALTCTRPGADSPWRKEL